MLPAEAAKPCCGAASAHGGSAAMAAQRWKNTHLRIWQVVLDDLQRQGRCVREKRPVSQMFSL